MKEFNTVCSCRWCKPFDVDFKCQNTEEIKKMAEHLLSCSGGWDDSAPVHALCLAVKQLIEINSSMRNCMYKCPECCDFFSNMKDYKPVQELEIAALEVTYNQMINSYNSQFLTEDIIKHQEDMNKFCDNIRQKIDQLKLEILNTK